ncbi:2,3-bisphosphoglycerate-independent phosphoglycerate mutase [Candidatus Termititenax persephonae]|uniref:2,3-bisphosphoglycerate-independent phosphoglycerate mutase n=1 Tax=Candidatus Termititenax persephonae TaxID=2218525 RepID=A0A388TJ74_9BACT|nr:2,3-bisphosphoglycerate-independent phosphoglycerate mutase [Candidatus Termititenax persephonae]
MATKLMLIILDGWGINHNRAESAIEAADTPNMDRYWQDYPHTTLRTDGEAVGLPDGQMGNSEVGHLNLGAGRIVYQELTRITKSIRDGDFFQNKELLAAVENCRKNNSALHLMGLFSDGGVHSHLTHLYGLLELAQRQGLSKVFVHAFLDGRDVPPRSAQEFFRQFAEKSREIGAGRIATITGRYYAMDRDNRWERVRQAYELLTELKGLAVPDALSAMAAAYARDENDEFVKPTVVLGAEPVQDGDAIVFFNFRPDRARELTRAFTDQDFAGFARTVWPRTHFVCLTQYDETVQAPVAFAKEAITNCLAEVLSRQGLRQLHTAETEKYAHVTFFFNGGREEPYPGEDRILVASPKVATYDLQPEMSAPEVADRAAAAIKSGKYEVVILNFANADMVGHTGILAAAQRAVEAVDQCVGRLVDAVRAQGGELLITADHGNSDQMLRDGEVWTAHSLNPVPLIYVTDRRDSALQDGGVLADIAPTMLEILGIEKPREFTGRSLLA